MAAVRRHLIIEPRFQAAFTFAFVRGVLVAIAVPALITFLTVEMIAKNPALSAAHRLAIADAERHLVLVFIMACGVLGSVSAIVGLFISHRYAGPLKRVESWAARHLLGEPVEELVLRPGDELVNISATLARIMKADGES